MADQREHHSPGANRGIQAAPSHLPKGLRSSRRLLAIGENRSPLSTHHSFHHLHHICLTSGSQAVLLAVHVSLSDSNGVVHSFKHAYVCIRHGGGGHLSSATAGSSSRPGKPKLPGNVLKYAESAQSVHITSWVSPSCPSRTNPGTATQRTPPAASPSRSVWLQRCTAAPAADAGCPW